MLIAATNAYVYIPISANKSSKNGSRISLAKTFTSIESHCIKESFLLFFDMYTLWGVMSVESTPNQCTLIVAARVFVATLFASGVNAAAHTGNGFIAAAGAHALFANGLGYFFNNLNFLLTTGKYVSHAHLL